MPFWMIACAPEAGDSKADPADSEPADSAGETGETDSVTDSDSATDTETGTDTDSGSGAAAVSEVSWSLDDNVGSLGIVSWEQTAEASSAWVEFSVDGVAWNQSPPVAAPVGAMQAWVAGVPYDADVSFRVVNDFGEGGVASETYTGRTSPLPEGVETPATSITLPDQLDAGFRFLLLAVNADGDVSWKIILDRQGRVVWAHPSPSDTGSMQVSVDGTQILWDDDAQNVYRMTLDAEVLETVELSGLHHTFVEVADNALVWGGKTDERDAVWERAADGTVRQIFDCATYWEEHGATMPCDGNTLFWSAPDDSLLFSSDNETTVVELDRASGAVLRQWGQLDGSWGFAEGSSAFYKQHSPLWTSDGHLMLSSWLSNEDHTMVAREYELDTANEELIEVWMCDAEDGIVADYSGETRRLAGGNTLLNYGPGAAVREYTPDCELAWETAWSEDTAVRRMTVLSDLYPLLSAE